MAPCWCRLQIALHAEVARFCRRTAERLAETAAEVRLALEAVLERERGNALIAGFAAFEQVANRSKAPLLDVEGDAGFAR
jgi:hypothetical protein